MIFSLKMIWQLRMRIFLFLLVAFLIIFPNFFSNEAFLYAIESSETSNITRYSLDRQWQFRQAILNKWYKATVPGCVHTNLMDNGLIQDPYYRDNEIKVQWIEKENWEYKKEFEVSETLMDKNHIELVCRGLDTYAKVFMNDEKIAETDNIFRGD